jgi:hypothetical protein
MLDDMSSIEQHPEKFIEKKLYNFQQKRNLGLIETDSKVSRVSTETSVDELKVSVDFSERNASAAETRSFSLLCRKH